MEQLVTKSGFLILIEIGRRFLLDRKELTIMSFQKLNVLEQNFLRRIQAFKRLYKGLVKFKLKTWKSNIAIGRP